MEVPRIACMLVGDGGASRRVGARGVSIGRQADCDLVVTDPRASRRHALVRLTADGAEVIPLGRQPIEVNGKTHVQACELRDGDIIELPGLRLTAQISAQRPDANAAATFQLQFARGGVFGITHNPFVVGGGATDDLIVESWPPHALVFHIAQRELFVELGNGSKPGRATRNGEPLAAGALESITAGDVIGYRDDCLTIVQRRRAPTTALGGEGDLPRRVVVELLPRGGRIVLSTSDGEHVVFLHERRLDLIVALLRPPAGNRAGDFIADEVVAGIVWPRNAAASRTEINVLIARCRKDFVEAGLAGPRLLQRAPTGGATRFALAPDADVVIHG